MDDKPKKIGRKSEYSDEVASRIVEETANGLSLVEIANIKGIPARTTIYRWLDDNEDFRNRYARARESRADKIADEVISIADTETCPQRARNRMDARKWAAGKMSPKAWGDKTIIAGTGDKDEAIMFDGSAGLDMIFSRLMKLADRSDG